MITKMILPYLGGTLAVWDTCLFFFQTFLLAGYAYAHWATRWIGTRRHALLHLGIMLAAVCFLPIHLPVQALAKPDILPVEAVFSALFFYAGLPFFVLSASSPLLTEFYSFTFIPSSLLLGVSTYIANDVGNSTVDLWTDDHSNLLQALRWP